MGTTGDVCTIQILKIAGRHKSFPQKQGQGSLINQIIDCFSVLSHRKDQIQPMKGYYDADVCMIR